jgi:hypothetical protein
MDTREQEMEATGSRVIETTLGELISAISDAARESTISETDLSEVTHIILHDLLRRRKN